MSAGLTVDRLSVDRGGRTVLHDLSFHLPPGAAVLVTGSNGAGKSTLLRAVAGLIPRLSGRVRLEQPDRGAKGDADVGELASYLGHGHGLKLSLTAAENLRFEANWGGLAGLSAEAALGAVGLGHVADFPVRILSAGQRRRVALAALLVARRPLWLLDEPATALDAAAEALLVGLLRAHLGTGGMVLAAIHGPLDLPARQLHLGHA